MNVLELFKKITTFVFDVDGVLTDGTVLVLDNGLQARRMNIKDGFALQMAIKNGYRVRIISGGNSPQVVDRLEKLGVKDISMSVLDKKAFLEEYLKANKLKKEEVLYMGDDLPDLAPMLWCGFSIAPANAHPWVRERAHWVTQARGGQGAARELCDLILDAKGLSAQVLRRFTAS